ncbi:MAG: lipid II flippase MurJ [Photobacterium frigidiphilum]|uniref:murein biosynthesis integral membrane protein MurJ n=1 Tax=Photobacterium frigidiphilum TaxID=264736 RepID=UPI003002013D
MTKVALLTALIALVSQLLGFTREILVAKYYGISYITDAYIVSVVSPTILMGFIASGLASVFIPKYIKLQHDNDVRSANLYTSNLILILLLLGTLVAFCCYYFSGSVIKLFAVGFSSQAGELADILFHITILSSPFILINVIYIGYLQIKGDYIYASSVLIPSHLVSITFVIISYLLNSYIVLAVGYLVGILTQFLLLSIKSNKYKLFQGVSSPKITNEIKDTYFLALPVMIGASVNQVNYIFDRTMASTVGDGAISIINYSSRISSIIEVVLITTMVSLFYPKISEAINCNIKKFNVLLNEVVLILILITIPCSFYIYYYSVDIIDFIFGRGEFGVDQVKSTASILSIYGLAIPFVALKMILNKVSYAFGKTKIPTIISIFCALTNITLNYLLVDKFGLSGIAFATVISTFLSAFILLIYLFTFDNVKLRLVFLSVLVCIVFIDAFFSVMLVEYLQDIIDINIPIILKLSLVVVSFVMFFCCTGYFWIKNTIDNNNTLILQRFSNVK